MNDTINDPYRTAPVMPEAKAKFPRLVFEQLDQKNTRRLVQLSEEEFVVERRHEHKDSLGMMAVTWGEEARLNSQVSPVPFCLAKKLSEVLLNEAS